MGMLRSTSVRRGKSFAALRMTKAEVQVVFEFNQGRGRSFAEFTLSEASVLRMTKVRKGGQFVT